MTKKIERYFGFQISIARDIETNEYLKLQKSISEVCKNVDVCRDKDFNIFITRLELAVTRERVFKVAPLTRRLEGIDISLNVNPRDKENKRIFFLNHEIEPKTWLISEGTNVDAKKYSIKISIDGEYCQKNRSVELLILTCVSKQLPISGRKLSLKVTAKATAEYATLLRNVDGGKVTAGISYYLDSRVQFSLPFGPE